MGPEAGTVMDLSVRSSPQCDRIGYIAFLCFSLSLVSGVGLWRTGGPTSLFRTPRVQP